MQTGGANEWPLTLPLTQNMLFNKHTNTTGDGVVDVRRECWPRVVGSPGGLSCKVHDLAGALVHLDCLGGHGSRGLDFLTGTRHSRTITTAGVKEDRGTDTDTLSLSFPPALPTLSSRPISSSCPSPASCPSHPPAHFLSLPLPSTSPPYLGSSSSMRW